MNEEDKGKQKFRNSWGDKEKGIFTKLVIVLVDEVLVVVSFSKHP